jgi:sensor histidine kinase YesM
MKGYKLPMLLIPFVENAFKHSNIENIEEAFITIDLRSKRNHSFCC